MNQSIDFILSILILILSYIIFYRNLLNNCSLQRLQLKGLCLLKLKIEQKFTGLYGRTIVVLNTAVHGKVINTQYFSSGFKIK